MSDVEEMMGLTKRVEAGVLGVFVNDRTTFLGLMDEKSVLEGFRVNNLIATWIIGPLLPLNPPFTAWLLSQVCGTDDVTLAFEEEARAAYEKRLKELKAPGMHLAY